MKKSRPTWVCDGVSLFWEAVCLNDPQYLQIILITALLNFWKQIKHETTLLTRGHKTPTFSSQCISLVSLEEWSGGRSGSEAVHLPSLDTGTLSSWGQTRSWRPRRCRRHRGRHSTLLNKWKELNCEMVAFLGHTETGASRVVLSWRLLNYAMNICDVVKIKHFWKCWLM